MANYVGPQANTGDGASTFDSARVTKDGARVTADLHGKYYEQASRARAYFGSSAAAGIAIIAPATGGGHPTLWNPSDSGRDLSIVRLELGYVSGNNAPTTFGWAVTRATGASIATGAAIATGTRVAPEPCRIGGASDYKGIWLPTVNTFTAAPGFLRSTGLSLFTGIATTAVAPFKLVVEYDGDLVLAPGTALSLCTQAATTTALFQVTLTWEEIGAPS